MSIKKLLALALIASFMSCAAITNAQIHIPSPRFESKPVDSIENTQPWAELGTFNYDAQMFAPVQFTNQEELDPNVGFFFVMDRMYTSIGKPGSRIENDGGLVATSTSNGSNYHWGNRFEGGWMSEGGDGWGIVYERTQGSFFTAGQDRLVANPMLVSTDFANVEVNRIFRQALSQGGHVEPYIGFRYMSLSDNTIEDSGIGFTGANRFKQNATNNIAAGHVGARYTKRSGRFRTTLDGSIATGYNRQSYFATDLQTGAAGGPQVNESYDNDSSFVPVADIRLELAYNMSRDLGFRTGFQLMYLWDGVTRADTLTTALNSNSAFGVGSGISGVVDESLTAAGFSFGIEWKR